MRFFIILTCQLILLLAGLSSSASTYFVTFKYKTSKGFSLNNPSAYLTDKSIRRRISQRIIVDSSDLPVSRAYLGIVRSLGGRVILSSKWFNGALVETSDNQANSLLLLDFVKDVRLVYSDFSSPKDCQFDKELSCVENQNSSTNAVYGGVFDQVNLLKGGFLHDNGFKGRGVTIAVLDAGFSNYENDAAFSNLRNGQVVDVYDFTTQKPKLEDNGNHGIKVLSLLAAMLPGNYCGSAVDANYALYVTESEKYEQLIEEYFWCVAAERADSLGCDIIASSLGYNYFDNPLMDHAVCNLSKQVVPISIAASTAFKKGIFVVVSAGNEGDKVWRYITFPADSPDVMAVGAVDRDGLLGEFSSIGLPKTVKPDVVGMGVAALMIDAAGNVVQGSGTSYAVPQIAGFSACLWQAFPFLSAVELKNVICKSSSNYSNPDNLMGYGIPNFEKAYQMLKLEHNPTNRHVSVSPNPFTRSLTIKTEWVYNGVVNYYMYNMQGKLVKAGHVSFAEGFTRIDDLESLPSGVIIIKLIFGDGSVEKKIVKQG